MELKSNKRGITLIALIIIIIVLLILAGVTISMLTGENGILNQAVTARNRTRRESIQEQIALWEAENKIEEATGGTKNPVSELLDDLEKSGLINSEERESIESTNQLVIGEEEPIIFPTDAKTLVEAFKDGEIKVGDYITNYNQKLKDASATVSLEEEETGHTGTQTYQVDTSTTWRVLGLSEDETQLIITTGSPIKKVMNESGTEEWEKDPYLYLNSGEGYYYTNDELTDDNILDRICKIYDSDLAESTKSMRIEDITGLLGLTVDEENNIMYKTDDPEKTPIEDSFMSYIGQTYTYKAGNYAPENYLKEKYPSKEEFQSLTSKKVGDTVEGSAYGIAYQDPSIIDPSSKLYEILFDGITEEENFAKSYWLASSGVHVYGSSYCTFGPGNVKGGGAARGDHFSFQSGGGSREYRYGVRPVVYLKSDITVEELTIRESGTEEEWTTETGFGNNAQLGYGQISE